MCTRGNILLFTHFLLVIWSCCTMCSPFESFRGWMLGGPVQTPIHAMGTRAGVRSRRWARCGYGAWPLTWLRWGALEWDLLLWPWELSLDGLVLGALGPVCNFCGNCVTGVVVSGRRHPKSRRASFLFTLFLHFVPTLNKPSLI